MPLSSGKGFSAQAWDGFPTIYPALMSLHVIDRINQAK